MNQIGARFLAKKNKVYIRDTEVCTSHYKPVECSIPVKDGVRKRPRCIKRKAD